MSRSPSGWRERTELIRQRQGVTLRPFNMADFKNEVEKIKVLYNQAWEKNWGFVPMTDKELDHLADQFKPVVIPELVPFAEHNGQDHRLRPRACPISMRSFGDIDPAGSRRRSWQTSS